MPISPADREAIAPLFNRIMAAKAELALVTHDQMLLIRRVGEAQESDDALYDEYPITLALGGSVLVAGKKTVACESFVDARDVQRPRAGG